MSIETVYPVLDVMGRYQGRTSPNQQLFGHGETFQLVWYVMSNDWLPIFVCLDAPVRVPFVPDWMQVVFEKVVRFFVFLRAARLAHNLA